MMEKAAKKREVHYEYRSYTHEQMKNFEAKVSKSHLSFHSNFTRGYQAGKRPN
jgi:hypothetical protein